MSNPSATDDLLSAQHVLEYAYKRSLGPVMSRFFTGLRDGRIEGTRTQAGRVLVPPSEYDPETGEAIDDFVEVGPGALITTWAWVSQPRPEHPLDRPFAWALLRLDGADSAMLHVVDAGSEERMQTGMRVQVKWREERVGRIQDIECFVPEDAR